MNNIEITQSGITKLLSELNVDKAPGPDELPNLLLKNAAKEISPMNGSRLLHYYNLHISLHTFITHFVLLHSTIDYFYCSNICIVLHI